TLGAKYEVEEIPADLKGEAQHYRDLMIEKVAEAAHEAGDDTLFEKYVAGQTPTVPEIKAAIRKATIEMKLFPVICGSAFKNKGIQPLLDAVVDYLPSPADLPPTPANDPITGEIVPPAARDDATFPAPVISLAVEPKTKADQEKLGSGLAKLMSEDPTFRVETDKDTGQTKISGMGELHLEIIVDRLKREFGV